MKLFQILSWVTCLLLLTSFRYLYQYQSGVEDTLENKKNSYNSRHTGYDNKHREWSKDGKHFQNHHIEIGQFYNQYQESAFQFLSAIFNKIEAVHHNWEIVRHKKDPFLGSDSKLYKDINTKKKFSGVEHYEKKSKVSIQQANQVLFGSEAVKKHGECIDVNYYTPNGNDADCSSNCDCTGQLFCLEGKCLGNSGQQSQSFQQAQTNYRTNMLENYFLNLVQKNQIEKIVKNYLETNYTKGVKFDFQSQREVSETLYTTFYMFQQLVNNPKNMFGYDNTYVTYNQEAFKWIAKQARDAIASNLLEFKDYNLVKEGLEMVDLHVQNVKSQIQDPSDLQQWINFMQQEIDFPDQDLTFPEISKEYNDFNQLYAFTSDNYGSYQSFGQVFNSIQGSINFDGGEIVSQGTVQIFSVAKVTVKFIFASLLDIFIF